MHALFAFDVGGHSQEGIEVQDGKAAGNDSEGLQEQPIEAAVTSGGVESKVTGARADPRAVKQDGNGDDDEDGYGAGNQTLTSLHLAGNRVWDEGCMQCAATLEQNESLLHLDLSMNKITDAGVDRLVKALVSGRLKKNMHQVLSKSGFFLFFLSFCFHFCFSFLFVCLWVVDAGVLGCRSKCSRSTQI